MLNHIHVGFSIKSNYDFLSPNPNALQNPRMSSPPSAMVAGRNLRYNFALKCSGIGISDPVQRPRLNSRKDGHGAAEETAVKDIDVAAVGNICLDIVLNVPKLPPGSMAERKAYMEELAKCPPDKEFWEAGGNCNMVIAAARLGLRTVTIGHVGNEIYGRFLSEVLDNEGIGMVEMSDPNDVDNTLCAAYETLLCWVLVDPLQRHDFCSRADFQEDPTFCWMQRLSIEMKMAIRRSKIIFCNGYGFDELSPDILMSILDYAVEVGTSIFFDPGPRGKFLINGTDGEQRALDKYLRMCDVLLLTSEEAEVLTGIEDPILSGKELLRRGIRTKWVIIKMGSIGSILISHSSISCAPAFKLNAADTVGCGDSFVAAVVFGYIHKMPLIYILTIGNAVGAATAMGCGGGRNVANLKKVVELLWESNLNEDDDFWEELLKEHSEIDEITLLTEDDVDGNMNGIHLASLREAILQLLPELERPHLMKVGTC